MAHYRRPLDQVWRDLVTPAPVLRAPAVVAALTRMNAERGTMFELGVVLEGLRGSHDDLLFFRPAMDMVGRDLLVQLAHTSRALYLQIKGRLTRHHSGSIRVAVQRDTFVPADDFWLAFFYYDQLRRALFEDCWLVPSVDFARLTADQRDPIERTFSATLDPARDRWREFRHPVGAQAAVLRRALKTLAR